MRGTRVAVLAAVAVSGVFGGVAPASAAPVELEVLSSRADLVSGGDALVRVKLDSSNDLRALRVDLGGRDVTEQFARRANGEVEALLTGIPDERVTLTATVPGRHGAKIELTGHTNGGPLISGPQLQPWGCQEGAVDSQCNQPARYAFFAKTSDGFVPVADPKSPPANTEKTTTPEGETVPFIVRVEAGYQVRDQYKIATLYDPAQPWEPWAPQRAWNRRIVFTHGGSCGTDRAAGNAPDVMRDKLLGKGFIVASTALNNLGHNCNPAIIVESELMARERIVEQYGPVRATLGTGCSGGAIAQMMAAHAYPGFYDGITVQCMFADLFTTGKQAISGHLFRRLFSPPAGRPSGAEEWPLVSSGNPAAPAQADDTLFDTAFWPAIDGSGGCKNLPKSHTKWSPSNPGGVRCGVLDHNVNVLGTGATGYVGIPFDNVGVQYGLEALKDNLLTPQQFVEINRDIGGLDPLTLAYRAARTEGELPAIRNAYRAGYMAIGNTLPDTPIIEGRGSNEATAHVTYPTKVIDARLRKFAGSTESHVLWEGPVPLVGNTSFADRMVLEMDRWVAKIQADGRAVPQAQRVRENKPADLTNRCETEDGTNQPGPCPLVRYYDAPTQVAGEGPEDDIMKCQLKPVDRADYPLTMLPAQIEQLKATFPNGVCDWSKPGVGETETVPWLTFADGPGGRELGAAPRSAPFVVTPSGQGGGVTPGTKPPRVRALLTRRVLSGRRLRLACRLKGATLRSCRVTVLVRRGGKLRKTRTVKVAPGRARTVRLGTGRRFVLRARLVAADGRTFTVRRSLTRTR